MSVDTIAARPAFAEEPLGGTVAERLARLPQIVADLQRADAAAERERVLQYDAVQRLRHAGILSLRVPARYGGPGGSVRDVLGAVIQIARGSSNVAQALRPHFGFAERLLSNRATEVERVHWFPRFTEGLVFGNAITDGHGRSPSSAQTRVIADADGVLRLNGYKFYSTGTLFADLIAVSAVDADGLDVQVIVPADREGVELYDDWDGFGQRATASGGTRFTDVVVHPFEVTTVSDGKHLGHGTTFLQLYLAAVTAGIAAAVADDAVTYVRTRARPAAHSLADSASGDPFVLQAVGDIAADAAAAGALVLAAADRIDALVDGGRENDAEALAELAVEVAKAQLVAERLALGAAARLFDTGGASATARALNLDRHWRNVRTIASHNPLAYKSYAAGNYAVNGVWPPANGYF
ncbi:acyl-CoA dehydrogenase family protein [Mycolicibacterium phlei]|jgi:alkylation response protein AidB-like acyl-CoA dehydrogenase|uniref:Acyl-CoA dehydrogenase n=1 Tax=Mycolicibacterium phlei DSM 43239 = CCUG 21000 TaxID=1226750 RepID=A0A5N5USD1_MYCPH|nr:acyl-CoA dehydrogenase family protein [Mycolicibacterium phlei]KAB7752516.1 acyl-CoA dehydrogenase [Mycolicibacterium phlei DSM 43239 = CCUG 21000]KXW60864.1 acyl-CoA dehydrogenase [Mycolicibacterium phlei DSM 43239 = CCUG 21000]KXW62908.1 acyl-CoA dehydrogenase [Mycolicibacterium phlei DSM 43072]KXW71377.1 acyl-CoA dehydrogenase [Mycolicibacterium phlei DSM 43070]KXW76304.1 acyl-CoA dehydrogenase [Mycolicibacterium phlei DSM 43071]